jgi:hypothetical protein
MAAMRGARPPARQIDAFTWNLTAPLWALSRCGARLVHGRTSAAKAHQAMLNGKNVVSVLRRDVSFVWHAVIAVMFVGFAGLAVAAALFDLLSLHR